MAQAEVVFAAITAIEASKRFVRHVDLKEPGFAVPTPEYADHLGLAAESPPCEELRQQTEFVAPSAAAEQTGRAIASSLMADHIFDVVA
jgi:hypothetical protein